MFNGHIDENLPLVSIIIPCFNSEDYIAECIKSVLDQDYDNLEVIVVDDGSTDSSQNIIATYHNVMLYTQENSGASIARNLGLSKCKGDYVKFLDSDDFLEPGVIKQQVEFSKRIDTNQIAYGNYNLFKNNKKTQKDTYIDKSGQTASLILTDILTSTPLHKKWMLDEVGGFDGRLKNGQEWNLHIRLSSKGFIFVHQPLSIFNYRIHWSPNRISIQKSQTLSKDRYIYQYQKLQMTQEGMDVYSSGNVDAVFAKQYWSTARGLYRAGDRKLFKELLIKSKQTSSDYKKFWNPKYKVLFQFIGFRNTERLFMSLSLLKKDKASDYT